MNKSTLYITIGLPGCGKSTWSSNQKATVISTDAIRKELYGNENEQSHNQTVYSVAYGRIKANLKKNHNVIFDATNLTYCNRRTAIKIAKQLNCNIVAVFFTTDYNTCIKRQLYRSRKVPDSVILRMKEKLTIPTKQEGFTTIITI